MTQHKEKRSPSDTPPEDTSDKAEVFAKAMRLSAEKGVHVTPRAALEPMLDPYEGEDALAKPSSEKAGTEQDSIDLIKQVLEQRRQKDPKLAEKQRHLLELLKRDSSEKPPTD